MRLFSCSVTARCPDTRFFSLVASIISSRPMTSSHLTLASKLDHLEQNRGLQSYGRENLSAIKQAHKSDSVSVVIYGKFDKKRASPDKKGWLLWIIKSGKTPRQVRIVEDGSQGSIKQLQVVRGSGPFDFCGATQKSLRECRLSHPVLLVPFCGPSRRDV